MRHRPFDLLHPSHPGIVLLGSFAVCLTLALGLVWGNRAAASTDVTGHVWHLRDSGGRTAIVVEDARGGLQRLIGLRVTARGQTLQLTGRVDATGTLVVERARPADGPPSLLDAPGPRAQTVAVMPDVGFSVDCANAWSVRLAAYERVRVRTPAPSVIDLPDDCGTAEVVGAGLRFE